MLKQSQMSWFSVCDFLNKYSIVKQNKSNQSKRLTTKFHLQLKSTVLQQEKKFMEMCFMVVCEYQLAKAR